MSIAESDRDALEKVDPLDATEEARNIKANLRQSVEKARNKITAENEAKRAERNSRRWREERDPVEYDRQKANQREEYAAQIAAEEGRAVRAYVPVPGKTRAEHDENAKARHAEKERTRRANADQAAKDREADRKWAGRKRKAGWTDEQIEQGLADLATKRHYRQPDPVSYEDNPNFGIF